MSSQVEHGSGLAGWRPVAAIGWKALIVAAVSALVLLAAGHAAYARHKPPLHGKPPVGLPTPPPTPPGQLGQDLSGKLPVMNINEAPGDYLGEGHDQIASALNGDLNIYETNKYGGGTKVQTPTDLQATPNDGFKFNCQGFLCQQISPWGQADVNTQHKYESVGSAFSLTSVKVAASASNIYMAGATFDPNDPLHTYQLHLYKLPHDGSCASTACFGSDEKSVNLPSLFPTYTAIDPSVDERLIVATSLATGVVGGKTYVAVGLSDGGIFIFDQNLNQVQQITDMAVDCSQIVCDGQPQTPAVSLAFGAPGTAAEGFLTAGVVSTWLTLYAWRLNADGQEQSMSRAGGFGGPDVDVAMAAGVGSVNGQVRALYGLSNGIVFVLDPQGGPQHGMTEFTRFNAPGPVLGLNPVTSSDDDPTNQHVAVGIEGDQGEVLKWDGGALKPVPILANGATTGSWDQVRQWYPGYGAGRLQVANETGGAVQVSLHWRPYPSFGCWLNDAVADGGVPAFPGDDTSIPAGQSLPASSSFFIGALTGASDSNGSCASAEPGSTGEWSAYVVVTPADDPADRHIVKLLVQGPGRASIQKDVGGDLTAKLTGPGVGGSWGSWVLHVGGHAAPVAQSAPVLMNSSQRLTSAALGTCPSQSPVLDDPCRPIYRFDVSGPTWSGVGMGGQVAARIPPMTAQGTTEGCTSEGMKPLGQLMPVTTPTVSGNTVTLGNASFFWQDPSGATPLTAVRVMSGDKASNVVCLADLAAPAPDGSGGEATSDGLEAKSPGGGSTVTLRPNGVDQAPLDLTIIPSQTGGEILPNDRRYGLVYYRYDNNDVAGGLVTGLYKGDYNDYVAVGPWAGAYPDSGLGRGRPGKAGGLGRGRHGKPHGRGRGRGLGEAIPQNYLVTTNPEPQSVVAEFNVTGTPTAKNSSLLKVAPDRTQLKASGTATGGIEVPGCGSTCTLAPTGTAPALFQAGSADQGPVSGLLFSAQAINAVDTLPLQVVSNAGDAHSLGSATLQVNANQAMLTNSSEFWPCFDQIDTALVTSGELVPAPSVPVKVGGC